MAVLLRSAEPPDVPFLAESLIAIARSVREQPGSAYNIHLPNAVTPREFEYAFGFVQEATKLALIAEDDGTKIGCLLAEISESTVPTLNTEKVGTITACWVTPEFRKRGAGKGLVDQAEVWFRKQGVRFAELSYGADSETAGAAWTAQGYAPFRVFAVKDLGEPEHPPSGSSAL